MKKFQVSSFKFQDRRGFSLIEFVIYTAIIALVILFLFEFLVGIVLNQARGKAREAVISTTSTVINTIDFEIRHASAIYDTTSNFTSSNGQLSLVSTQNLPTGETETYVDIFLNSNQEVCIKRETTGVACISTDKVNITSLSFEKVTLQDGTESGARTTISAQYDSNDADLNSSFTIWSFTRLRNY